MIEPGDVDWANHRNNIDSSIGTVLSGDDAFREVTRWVEANDLWDETAVILTADHGHHLVGRVAFPLTGALTPVSDVDAAVARLRDLGEGVGPFFFG